MNVSDEERQDLCGYHMLIPILSDDELGGDGRKNDEDVEHFFKKCVCCNLLFKCVSKWFVEYVWISIS